VYVNVWYMVVIVIMVKGIPRYLATALSIHHITS